jgi:hypothetical protein
MTKVRLMTKGRSLGDGDVGFFPAGVRVHGRVTDRIRKVGVFRKTCRVRRKPACELGKSSDRETERGSSPIPANADRSSLI